MGNLLDIFKPKENRFFQLLHQMSVVAVDASKIIIDCVQVTNHNDAVLQYKRMKEQEHKGDNIQNSIFEELNETFISPFDREDINHLSSTMDDFIDLVNSCAKRIMLYNPKRIPKSALELAELTQEAAECIFKAIQELESVKKSPEKIKEYCAELDSIENRADDVYENFLIDLFESEKDAIEVIKLKEILHELERATDAAETVGKIIKMIIIKYS